MAPLWKLPVSALIAADFGKIGCGLYRDREDQRDRGYESGRLPDHAGQYAYRKNPMEWNQQQFSGVFIPLYG
ncbi:hypothetical protein D9M68_816500 [compost metagenome]